MVKEKSNKTGTIKNKRIVLKRQNILQLSLVVIIVVLINIISSRLFWRIDLTSEKRYSLTEATKTMLKELDDIVYFRIFLEGDLPAGFKQLRNETKEMLDEFNAYSDFIEYEFENPLEGKNKNEIKAIYNEMLEKGLNPTQINIRSEGGTEQKIIFPGAIITYKGRSVALQILEDQFGAAPEIALNNSIQSLEYNIASSIYKLVVTFKPKIGFLKGQGEPNNLYIQDAAQALSQYYEVSEVKINQKLKSLDEYKALIIVKPDSAFDEKDKFILDQFIMKGGKVLWFIDPIFSSMDSLQRQNTSVAFPKDLNISDMLFKYGVRLNTDLIMDLQALPIPIITGMMGNQPQQSLLPWYYFPIIIPKENHPVVKNLNAVVGRFISTIDTLPQKNIKKTILLRSSPYSKIVNTPIQVSLDILKTEPDERLFNKGPQVVAVLLEGVFPSVFKGRIPDVIAQDKEISFKEESVNNSMIVVADGDFAMNQVENSNGMPFSLPLGYDKYTRQSFGNKAFLLNAVNYLCDDSGLISARNKEITLRLLDKAKIKNNKLQWQLINTIIPILIVLIFAIFKSMHRKSKYTRKKYNLNNK